ncbi:MAG: acyl-CoA dehydrogenase [Gammaproteobacteria bacterium PRO9]|nr:acyl-CoA dehydrogenase [Gammaproteobacteria bacterium PRO9]
MNTESYFIQQAPRPRHGIREDWLLRSYVRHRLPPAVRDAIAPELDELGRLAAGSLWDFQCRDRLNVPVLTPFDPWGKRIDAIELTPLWREAEALAVKLGLTALPLERQHGSWSRVHQFLLVHLFHPVTDVYTCPLAMTDGAVRTLLASGNQTLIERAVPHLTSRDPAKFWTSGQWMTESTGGSDVGLSRTRAEKVDGIWRLYGKKWFTSAATSGMALTLARPAGNGPGGRGLALFYLETRDADGELNGIRIERLKDKLGTRKVPTAELTLEGTVAHLVGADTGGTQAMAPMLRITRTWNSVCAASFLRFGLGLAEDFATRRVAFGAPLADQPLHRETLDDVDAESAAAFLVAFELVRLLGRDEGKELTMGEAALLPLLTPMVKATTGKQVAAGVCEIIEAIGGAGYIEDTGISVLLRDGQVLPIWEGTTNVLSLDLLRQRELPEGLAALRERCLKVVADPLSKAAPEAAAIVATAVDASVAEIDAAIDWLTAVTDPAERQRGARRCLLTLGRSLALALLAEHAVALAGSDDLPRALAICRRFQKLGVNCLATESHE